MVTFTTPVVGTSPRKLEPFRPAPAARLGPDERKDLALHVLVRARPVTRVAAELHVSRKFAYRQAAKASDALDAAFDPSVEDDTILFQLPVTKKWIESADVFHPLRELGQLTTYLENRASGLNTALQRLQRKMERAKKKGRGNTLSKKLAVTCEEEAKAAELARDVRTLSDRMRNDILSLAGPEQPARRELFDFVAGTSGPLCGVPPYRVEELRARESLCPHRIRPVRRSLQNQLDDLLAFAAVLDGPKVRLPGRSGLP